jgi:phage gp46-like protein
MSDVRLFQTPDGGEISVVNGVAAMDGGLNTYIYLCLFGGNDDDPGESDTTKSWWGNSLETDPNRQLRSRTQNMLKSIPATSGNVKRIKIAVESDIEFAVSSGVLKEAVVTVSIPKLNRVSIVIDSEVGQFEYMEPWGGSQ